MRYFGCVMVIVLLFFSFSCKKEEAKSSLAILEEFAIEELPDIEFAITAENKIEATVPDGTSLSSLTAVFTISQGAKAYVGMQVQGSGYTKKDFSDEVVYRIVAEDGTTNEYTVIIYTDIVIKSYSIVELPNTIFSIDENNITATVLYGSDLSVLTAKFTVSEESELFIGDVKQVSEETTNDFTNPLSYKLQSANKEKSYTVTITEADNVFPVADAGEDKIYYIPQGSSSALVSLDATGSSDVEGEIAAYEWNNGSETLATTKTAEVALSEGEYTITLTVTDAAGATASDEVVINVLMSGSYVPIDENATQETKNLLSNLGNIANSDQFIFGQEFPLSFKLNALSYDLTTSDCKDVTGDHPGVYGIDPHYMLYKSDTEKQLHIDEAKEAYQNGAVVTFDFHQQSRTDNEIYMSEITSETDKTLLYDIVNNNNGARTWFYEELDAIIDIINNDLGFPVVWRLYHEMGGGWFWWGSEATYHSSDLYISFYQLAVDYIKEKSDLVLFAWSPNYPLDESYYPGDAYVDIVGVDIYEPTKATLKSSLVNLSSFALEHNKIAVLAETGYRNDYINTKPEFWNDNVLDAIKEGSDDIRIAWVLAWFNAPWTSSQSDLYIPNSDSPQNAKDEFILFKNDQLTLFQEDVKELNIYD